ncbi:MAG: hypothetical protein Q9204_007048 [Flavoplaca sp. TL-2023a]
MMTFTTQEIEQLVETTHTRLYELCVTRFMCEMKKKCPLIDIGNKIITYDEDTETLIIEQIECLAALSTIRTIDDVAIATRDLRLLIDKGESVCKEEAHADKSCPFRLLHSLIVKSTADLARLKAVKDNAQ